MQLNQHAAWAMVVNGLNVILFFIPPRLTACWPWSVLQPLNPPKGGMVSFNSKVSLSRACEQWSWGMRMSAWAPGQDSTPS